MKLKFQIFIILLGVSATLIAALFAFNNWSFNRGFVDYLNRTQTAALETLVSDLTEDYATHGSWDWLSEDPSQWRLISRDAWNEARQEDGPRPPGSSGGRSRPEPPPPLVLTDASKNVLFGRLKEGVPMDWMPIGSSENLNGFLGFRSAERVPRQVDRVFATQQRKSFAMASFLMVGLSALLAALLAARIVKPVVEVSQAVAEIRRGDYKLRVLGTRSDELGDLSRDVNQLASTLEQSQTARRKWIAEISHELRTPLAILQGEVEAIADGIRPFNAVSLESLHAETRRMSRLVDDLHDLSLSDLGALNYQMAPLNLASIVRERLTAAEAKCNEKSLNVVLKAADTNYPIMGDHQRVGQLIDNLLQNSIRYTHPEGEIVIELTHTADSVHLRWMDSTPGVSDDDLPQLFDPLFRAEQSRNRNLGGAGLGLAITQKIVTAHQGSLSAKHAALGGLQIDMQFPSTTPVHDRNIR